MRRKALRYALISVLLCISSSAILHAQITGFEAARQMRGINIGNTLDAPEGETSWGQPLIQEYYFDDYKDAGFTAVRVCVTWQKHMLTTSPYTVDSVFMNRVEQVCDWGLKRGLFIIVNSMHDGFVKDNYNSDNKKRFDSLWSQIAYRFQDKSDHLLFEILNESNPIGQNNAVDLNARICKLIRNTGGNNKTRIIIYAGEGCSVDQLVDATPPPLSDHTYLIGNFHLYVPWGFVSDNNASWGSAGDWSTLYDIFGKVNNYAKSNNVAVMMNEFGCGPGHEWNSRMDFYECHVQNCLNYGFGFFAWDDGGGFNTYDRKNRKWIKDVKDVLTNPIISKEGCKADGWIQAQGVSRLPKNDNSGGYYAGNIATGDYMNYRITVPTSGKYKFEASVASPNNTGVMSVEKTGGSSQFAEIKIPNTGGWQKWVVATTLVELTKGGLSLSIAAANGGFNLDWIRLTPDSSDITGTEPVNNHQQREIDRPAISVTPDAIIVKGLKKSEKVAIYSITGKLMYSGSSSVILTKDILPGTYLVSIPGRKGITEYITVTGQKSHR